MQNKTEKFTYKIARVTIKLWLLRQFDIGTGDDNGPKGQTRVTHNKFTHTKKQ